MSRLAAGGRGARTLRTLLLSTAALWTLAVGSSLLWGAGAIRRGASGQARLPAPLGDAGKAWGDRRLEAAVSRYGRLITAGHAAVWLTGLGFVAFGGRWLLRLDREREEAERRLTRERETLRLLHEHSPDAVAVIDGRRRLVYANRPVEQAAGAPFAALRGRLCHEALRGDSSPCSGCAAEEVFREGRPAARVQRERAADGSERWLWQQWYPVRDAGGAVDSVVEISRDVSDLKRTEAELGRYAASLAEANRLKELFSDVLSHDLLNPVAAARYFVEQLRRGESDPRRLRLVDAIEHNLLRLMEMISNASLYSRLGEGRENSVQVLDLERVVRGVLAELEPELSAAGMSAEGPARGSYPAAVHPMFAHVVSNLVGNAVKYAATGGRVAVGIESAGPAWVLSIRDWGPGVAADCRESLFTRFERLGKEGVQGSGLGLAIARRIVELQAGSISVEDNPEGGSVFRVRVRKAAEDGPRAPCAAGRAAAGSGRVRGGGGG